MTDDPRLPAYGRTSTVLRLDRASSMEDLSPAWAWGGSTGRGARVAVVDSGIEVDHPDLGDCVDRDGGIEVRVESDGETTEIAGPHDDSVGHGTACAGIIHDIAPDATITSVKVLGPGLRGRAAAFLRGLAWAVEQRFDVINLSLGTNRREWALPFYEICDQAYFSGSLVVTAANNLPKASFPSLYASVASVASSMSTDPFRFHHNPEPPTEFLAPGVGVSVAWRGASRIDATGNSYAAPHISGIATLIRAKHPDLRPFQVKTALWATAANVREAPRPAGRRTLARGGTTSTRASVALRRR
ncbi:MAG: S8 family serine peptidase [Acidimicrobiales bacterium]